MKILMGAALLLSIAGAQAYAQTYGAGEANPTFLSGISTAGTNLATATVLTATINVVSTCTSGGVSLPKLVPVGITVRVIDRCGSNITVYPDTSSDSIESNGAGVAVTIDANSDNSFLKATTTQWLQ
jgi:hypothetical protein